MKLNLKAKGCAMSGSVPMASTVPTLPEGAPIPIMVAQQIEEQSAIARSASASVIDSAASEKPDKHGDAKSAKISLKQAPSQGPNVVDTVESKFGEKWSSHTSETQRTYSQVLNSQVKQAL